MWVSTMLCSSVDHGLGPPQTFFFFFLVMGLAHLREAACLVWDKTHCVVTSHRRGNMHIRGAREDPYVVSTDSIDSHHHVLVTLDYLRCR